MLDDKKFEEALRRRSYTLWTLAPIQEESHGMRELLNDLSNHFEGVEFDIEHAPEITQPLTSHLRVKLPGSPLAAQAIATGALIYTRAWQTSRLRHRVADRVLRHYEALPVLTTALKDITGMSAADGALAICRAREALEQWDRLRDETRVTGEFQTEQDAGREGDIIAHATGTDQAWLFELREDLMGYFYGCEFSVLQTQGGHTLTHLHLSDERREQQHIITRVHAYVWGWLKSRERFRKGETV
jgi:hypothetical protein